MLVSEVMTTEVVTVDLDATLRDVVGTLLAEGVGSVEDGTPMDLVTESDALAALHERGARPRDVPVREIVESGVVTNDPDRTVRHVANQMADEGVKKVVVTDDLDVVGIVTLTDIVWHLSDIRREATALADRDWGPRE